MTEKSSNFKSGVETPYDYNIKSQSYVREYQISLENMAIVRERLADCVRTETVNQFTNCKELREKYFELCNDRYRGMIFPEGAQPTNREVPGLIAPKIRSNF